jgi:hypothetical protein
MDLEIPIRKKGEGNMIFLFEDAHFIIGISRTDTHQLDFSLQGRAGFNPAVEAVHGGCLRLSVGAIHAEDFNDDHICLDLRDFKGTGKERTGNA